MKAGTGIIGYCLQCKKCHKKIMIELTMIGTSHHLSPVITCAECVSLTEEFQQKHPDITQQIKDWKENG